MADAAKSRSKAEKPSFSAECLDQSDQRAWLKAQADTREISMSDFLEEILQQAMGIKADQHAWLKAQADVRKIGIGNLLQEILQAEIIRRR